MDLLDKKIILELDEDSHQTDSAIAKKVSSSKEVVRYRINNLIKSKIIKTFQTTVNFRAIGIGAYANIFFSFHKTNSEKEKEIINYFIQENKVAYVASTSGRFDLSLVIVAKDIYELIDKIPKIISKHEKNLYNQTISLRIMTQKFSKKYLLDSKKESKNFLIIEPNDDYIKIDLLDKLILKNITKNSRMIITDLARSLKEPVTTIHSRIKKLKQNKIISGSSTLYDLRKIGIENYKILLTMKTFTKEKELFYFCQNHPNITWFFKTLAPWTHELRIEVIDQEEFQKILRMVRHRFGDYLNNIETLTIFEEFKEDYSSVL